MSKKANPTVIGAFVVGAVLLCVIAVLLLGGGTHFHRTKSYVLYFQGNVNGLAVGSAVKFLGVEIGSVRSIRLRITPEGATMIIPVIIRIDESLIEQKAGVDTTLDASRLQRSIEQGLRARLETESLVTGQRYVALSLEPDSPANLLGLSGELEEIPTLPTAFEEFQRMFEQFVAGDVQALVKDLGETSRGLSELLASPDTHALPASLIRTLAGIDGLVASLQAEVDPLSERIENTTRVVQEVGDELELTLRSLRAAAERSEELQGEVGETLAITRVLLAPDAPLAVQLQATLEEFAAAARSLRSLADLIERDPSALLRGKDLPSKP